MTFRVLAALLALALSVPTYAACTWESTGSYTATVTCADGDEAAPTLVTEGITLARGRVRGLSVTAVADSGQTITSGTFKLYIWDNAAAAWARHATNFTVPFSGERRINFEAVSVLVPSGRFAIVPSIVVVSGGGLTLYVTIAD